MNPNLRPPYHLILPYTNSADCIVFDAPEHNLIQEELCRGADTLWRHLRSDLPPPPAPSATPALIFSRRQLVGRQTRLHYLHQSPDDWSVWRVDCPGLPTLTELQLCPSLLLYYPDGPPARLHLKALWHHLASEHGASPSPDHTADPASHPHASPNDPPVSAASAPASSPPPSGP